MSKRSLLPREHGAYAQLLVPLATALALRPPSWSSVLFALAACCAFLANEPLLVALGHRGKRACELDGAHAVRRLAITACGAVVAGVAALTWANHNTRMMAIAVGIPSAL